tara:strand:+ start:45480 stop:45740 length:261 start_codon:yes stop_codon:yes gene_type:complete
MTKFLAIIFVAVCFLGVSARAQDIGNFAKNMGSLSKGEVSSSIEHLVKQGVISPEQAAQARSELENMDAKDIQNLQEQARKMLGSN